MWYDGRIASNNGTRENFDAAFELWLYDLVGIRILIMATLKPKPKLDSQHIVGAKKEPTNRQTTNFQYHSFYLWG